jgi:dolichol-phosphate mannosyltransferase
VAQEPTGSSAKVSRRSWLATVAVALLIYGAALHYLVLGLPGIGHSMSMSLKQIPIGWKEFGKEVAKIKTDLENATGKEPLRVGMDRYFISSEMAFYDSSQDAVSHTAGRSLFGLDSLMYDRWSSPTAAKGRDIVLVSRRSKGGIVAESLRYRFRTLGPIQQQIVYKGGIPVGRFYWRIGYGYIPNEP